MLPIKKCLCVLLCGIFLLTVVTGCSSDKTKGSSSGKGTESQTSGEGDSSEEDVSGDENSAADSDGVSDDGTTGDGDSNTGAGQTAEASKNSSAASSSQVVLTAPKKRAKTINGFARAYGEWIVDANHDEVFIKGIGFGNNVFGNPPLPPTNHHDEESYAELERMGFNSVRFLLNYRLFEEDSKPYQYKQTGWDWLDKNVAWAKKHNIRLVFNMHRMPGNGDGSGMGLYTDKENQNRLRALWVAIAKRYANETAVAGYGLINEPVLPTRATYDDTIAPLREFYQTTATAIRKVNKNHILFLERMLGYKTPEGVWGRFPADENLDFAFIDDPNVVYEFHDYEPFIYSHQDISDTTMGRNPSYPSDRVVPFETSWHSVAAGKETMPVEASKTSWQTVSSGLLQAMSDDQNIAHPVITANNTGANGSLWIDDIVIKEYSPNKTLLRTVYTDSMNSWDSWNMSSSNRSGSVSFANNVGNAANGSILVKGVTGSNTIKNSVIAVRLTKNNYYEFIFTAKSDANVGSNMVVKSGFEYQKTAKIYTMNQEYLEAAFKRFVKIKEEVKAPFYLGEFGLMKPTFTKNLGGDRWVTDMLDLCKKYNVYFSYHAYNEDNFGMYWGPGIRTGKNTMLYNVFTDKFPMFN